MTIEELTVYGAIGAPGTERTLAWELLALALERELGLPQMPEIAREPGGRPYFPACPDLCFNISHSRGGAVCALDRLPVGVDVELLRPAPGGWRGTWRTRRFSACGRPGRPRSSGGAWGSGPWWGEDRSRTPCAGLWRGFCPDMWSRSVPPGRPGSGPFSSRT